MPRRAVRSAFGYTEGKSDSEITSKVEFELRDCDAHCCLLFSCGCQAGSAHC